MYTPFLKGSKLIVCLLLSLSLFAETDKEKYRKQAEAIRAEIWAWNKPAFNVRTIPVAYNNFSYVTIAKHIDIGATSRTKFKFSMNWLNKEFTYTRTTRELVKINDKAALDDYSSFSYQQFEKKASYMTTSTSTTIIGVRLIKPNGSIKEVNTDEIIFTKDAKSDKRAKLAISDLQVGDMIDYFVTVIDKIENTRPPEPSYFVFGEENPIMSYSVHCEVGKKYAVEYRAMNGAPEFKESRGEDDDIVLDVEHKNMNAFPTSLWMSVMRQVPILRLNIVLGYEGVFANRINARKRGEVYRNQPLEEIIEDQMVEVENSLRTQMRTNYTVKSYYYSSVLSLVKKANKDYKDLPKDELAALVYYAFRFHTTYDVSASDDIEVGADRNYAGLNTKKFLFALHELFIDFKLNSNIIMATSKYGPPIKEAMSMNDFEYVILVNEDKPMYIGVDNLFTPAFFIPSEYAGIKKAPAFTTEGTYNKKNFRQTTADIPATKWSDNMQKEHLEISLDAANMQLMEIKRRTVTTGHYKTDEQKRLLLFEDYYDAERKALGKEASLTEELNKKRKTKSLSEEYKNAFAKARADLKERFTYEINGQFEMAPKDVIDYKVDTIGIRHTEPAFVYSTHFTMDGLVKKAGNNFILDIGKLIGGQLQLKPWQRDRKVDVYMPFARALDYNMILNVPAGYKAEGLDKLTQKVETQSGSFLVNATTVNNIVIINIRKIYSHEYEPVANWPQLLQVLDAAVSFGSAKLLLRKV